MNVVKLNANLHQFSAVFVLLAALALTTFSYYPGLGGSLHFDDPHSLGGLAQIVDRPSAIRFITEGDAGPLGRPLALASFVPQAYAWPDAPDVFLYTNICLHLLNGVLVVWLLYVLSIARGRDNQEAAWTSSMSGAIWMLLPILASSSLLIVQRMTTLSATFLLLGFIGYVYSRSILERRPFLAVALMSTCIILGTSIAALAKENGLLLPVFILATEITLLPRPSRSNVRLWWRAWCTILIIPAAVLSGYLALQFRYGESISLMRGFSASDRLLTEAHILWQYLYHAFFPSTSDLGPFHDDHAILRNWLHPLSMLAVAGWLAVLACAVACWRRAPLFCFAVSWYLIGHALESTTIPLELYFEHRNYLPLIGPVFALVAAASTVRWPQPYVRAGVIAYALVLTVVLFNTTSLWGQPALAGEIWAIDHPKSSRATQYLARQIQRTGDYGTVRRMLRRYLEEHPESTGVALQILALSCLLESKESHHELLETIETSLPRAGYQHGVFETIEGLYRMAENEQCAAVDRQTIYDLAAIAATNPAFRAVPAAHHNLHVLMSEEAFAQRNLDLTMFHIEAALSARYTMTTLMFAVRLLSSAGLFSVAEDFVQDARSREPRHPIRAAVWRQQIADLDENIRIAASDHQS